MSLTADSEPGTASGAHRAVPPERGLLRVGGVCAVLGTVVNVAAAAGHGDLPEAGTAAELAFVAARPFWGHVHLASIVGVLLWIGAFVAVAQSLHGTRGAVLARLAMASALVGAAVHVVFFSIDGFALKHTADAWAAAAGPRQADLLWAGDLVLLLQNSQFVSAIAFMLGLPFLLLGAAVARSRTYPAWLGWVGVLAGTGSMLTGMTRFVGLAVVPDPVLFPAFVLPASLGIAALGVLMWRRASAVR